MIDDNGQTVVTSSNNSSNSSSSTSNSNTNSKAYAQMCWLEKDNLAIQENYPALMELLDQLHSLPYELNGKTIITCLLALHVFVEAYYPIYCYVYDSQVSVPSVPVIRAWERIHDAHKISHRQWSEITIR